MKIWTVPARQLGDKQLLDEHRSIHAYFGMLGNPRFARHPFIKEFSEEAMRARHEEVVAAMAERGFNHKTPLPYSMK